MRRTQYDRISQCHIFLSVLLLGIIPSFTSHVYWPKNKLLKLISIFIFVNCIGLGLIITSVDESSATGIRHGRVGVIDMQLFSSLV